LLYFSLAALLGFWLWLGLLFAIVSATLFFLYHQTSAPLASKWLALLTPLSCKTSTSFVLSDSGECQFLGQEKLYISANSQINLWGYWLVFTENDALLTKMFIFKDSLSSEDQARLARTIIRIQKTPTLDH
jgi:hypothetical protein